MADRPECTHATDMADAISHVLAATAAVERAIDGHDDRGDSCPSTLLQSDTITLLASVTSLADRLALSLTP